MTNHWGIDTCERSDFKIADKTILEYVTENLQKPEFWGRYIGGNTCKLTIEEINYLHNNDIKIMVIYNGASPSRMLTEQQGIDDAIKATSIAASLGIGSADHKVIIYLDIEAAWEPTYLYLQGWSKTFTNSESLLPGFYCNTKMPNFDKAFCLAKADGSENPDDSAVGKTILYTTQPQWNPTEEKIAPEEWTPVLPTCTNESSLDRGVQVWQYKIKCLNELIDLDLMTPFAFERTF
ncbi:hypothetical protein CN582_24865 [Bacillus wiedmannii]|uniref:glycoside hydrolase domain-containing protein n=1 Tax=Bacillus wiedmannii TaxID=1890302 RepID=UPI000BF742D5|nr:glycoside hydrolase domain-containing protein [Bacillus wiedmannii]PEP92381.1 hypothetical protein CN582_24865 [Bacillus wiedmannii]